MSVLGLATRGYYGGGSGSSDLDPPVITVISPTPGVAPGQPGGFPRNRVLANRTPVELMITDAAPGIRYICVTVLVDDKEEVVYRRGSFRGAHVIGSSQRTSGSDLFLTVKRFGGWPSGTALVFSLDALDQSGNLAT